MIKALNSRCALRNQSFLVVRLSQCHYSSNRGRKRTGEPPIKDDAPAEPLQLSYNSYENLTSDSTTSPVLIMHGVSINRFPINSVPKWTYHNSSFPIITSGLFGSKQNWRGISKAIHSKTKPTRKVWLWKKNTRTQFKNTWYNLIEEYFAGYCFRC